MKGRVLCIRDWARLAPIYIYICNLPKRLGGNLILSLSVCFEFQTDCRGYILLFFSYREISGQLKLVSDGLISATG